MIQRYMRLLVQINHATGELVTMVGSPNGKFVRYEDHVAEIERLRHALIQNIFSAKDLSDVESLRAAIFQTCRKALARTQESDK